MNDFVRVRGAPYQPGTKDTYKLSRSKIDDFLNCPRCFWLDRRLKISKPQTPPFQINKAVDELFKKEFDVYRAKGEPHPLMVENKIEAVPFVHQDLNKWRENFVGVQYLHEPTNLLITGAVDDIWVDDKGELMVVDYKATAKKAEVSLDAPWQIAYKRQMEVYQWLMRKNGFSVNPVGYFVYTNGRLDLDGFFDRVEFRTKVIPYKGDDSWVESTLFKIKDCLESETIPKNNENCDYCRYARDRTELTLKSLNVRVPGHKKVQS
ncbi:MAG TPA: PD-(D/E)XK nuclease family protein [Patescibacteria group bacterium]|jgi:CRISPR/Cas system-associated exonuclease Cas4 (RecB family)|nr:PD-(D/E)XK nuclease family protein [Patescibacteria group bacterium]